MTAATNPRRILPHPPDRPGRFPPAPIADLVDRQVRHDLAESTSPPLRLSELLTPEVEERLRRLETGYGTTQGDPGLRELVAAGAGVDADQVLITPGGSAAMFLTTLALCEPGEHVVLVTPCFPPARTVPAALRVRTTAVPLSFDTGYRLDVDAVAAALTPETRLVSLASPQNPSGIRFTEDELDALLDRLEVLAPRAILLVDETYRESGYGDAPVPASAAGRDPRVLTCSSLSKSHGAPGLRIGWLTTTVPARYEALRLAKFNALIGGSGVDELLATEVLRQRDQILASRRATLTAALAVLDRWAAGHRETVEFLRPDGGALCCLRLRPDRFDEPAVGRFHAALADRATRVAPGSWFGESDRVFRIGFGHLPADDLAAGLDRVGDALHTV